MALPSDRVFDLLLGEERARTRRAVLLTGGFVIAASTLEYLLYLTAFENGVLLTLHQVFRIDGYLPTAHAAGALFAVSLAALHAYLNQGYLPSVLLGWSLIYGNLSWTIDLPGIEEYYLDPVAAFHRTFPEAVVLATIGFGLGLGLRWFRNRQQRDIAVRSESDETQSTE